MHAITQLKPSQSGNSLELKTIIHNGQTNITLLLSQRACTNSDTGHRLYQRALKFNSSNRIFANSLVFTCRESRLKSHLKEMTKKCVFLFTKYFPIRVQLIQNNLNTIMLSTALIDIYQHMTQISNQLKKFSQKVQSEIYAANKRVFYRNEVRLINVKK